MRLHKHLLAVVQKVGKKYTYSFVYRRKGLSSFRNFSDVLMWELSSWSKEGWTRIWWHTPFLHFVELMVTYLSEFTMLPDSPREATDALHPKLDTLLWEESLQHFQPLGWDITLDAWIPLGDFTQLLHSQIKSPLGDFQLGRQAR